MRPPIAHETVRFQDPVDDGSDDQGTEDDLWFLPGPAEDDLDTIPNGLRDTQKDGGILTDWVLAQAGLATALAKAACNLGALDDRLRRGPEGWRHRLALIEAAELSWLAGDRIGADRVAQWIALRLAGVQEDAAALARAGWAVRRLTGGPGPKQGLAEFLGRHDPEAQTAPDDRFADRAANWHDMIEAGPALHPISLACMSYHCWNIAGLGQTHDRIEASVTAARLAAVDLKGAIFAPLAMGGATGLRAGGNPTERLARWLGGLDAAILTAMRHLDRIGAWTERAEREMAVLSGRTPAALLRVLSDWPLISAPMAETLTGASRAAVQRNLAWMEERKLICEVTGQGRFRMWRALV
jgi:hypothetical protein